MAKKIAGVDVLVNVTDSANKLVPIGGQKGASLKRKADTIDVSDKTSGGWAESIVGMKSWSVECDGFVCIGDNGFDLVCDAFDNRKALPIKINVGNQYTYEGEAVITDFPEEYAQDGAVTYSLTLQGASPLVKNVADKSTSSVTSAQ